MIIGPIFAIYAPCVFNLCDESFEIFQFNKADLVARIAKFWDENAYTKKYDLLGTNFHLGLSVKAKALILGACITLVS